MGELARGLQLIGIIQGNYIPWPGYFEFIRKCDQFIVLDDVQYTTRDWRNRNRIKGDKWLTIPVKNGHRCRIDEVELAEKNWSSDHWRILKETYKDSDYFHSQCQWIHDLYDSVSLYKTLSSVNVTMLKGVCEGLGIETPIYSSSPFCVPGVKSEKLIGLCHLFGADRYLSGPTASYIKEEEFERAGIEVEWMKYSDWPKYSIVDWIFNHGCKL